MWSICIRVVLVMIFALHCPFSMAPLMVLAWDSEMETPCCPHRIRHHRGKKKSFVFCFSSFYHGYLHYIIGCFFHIYAYIQPLFDNKQLITKSHCIEPACVYFGCNFSREGNTITNLGNRSHITARVIRRYFNMIFGFQNVIKIIWNQWVG